MASGEQRCVPFNDRRQMRVWRRCVSRWKPRSLGCLMGGWWCCASLGSGVSLELRNMMRWPESLLGRQGHILSDSARRCAASPWPKGLRSGGAGAGRRMAATIASRALPTRTFPPFERLRPLRLRAQRDAGCAQQKGLLLHAAGVRGDAARESLERQHVHIADRIDQPDPLAPRNAIVLHALARAWMDRKHHVGRQVGQGRGVVGVDRASTVATSSPCRLV